MSSGMAERPGMTGGYTPKSHDDLEDGEAVNAECDSGNLDSGNLSEPSVMSIDENPGQTVLRANDVLLSRLSIEDAIKLDDFLSKRRGSAFSSIESIDGMLTAIAISPGRAVIGHCQDELCIDLSEGNPSKFVDEFGEFEFRILTLRYLRSLWQIFRDDSQKYEPVLLERESRGECWARGFMHQFDRMDLYWSNLVRMNDRLWEHYIGIYELSLGVEVNFTKPEHENESELSPERRENNIKNIGDAVEQFSEADHEALEVYLRELKDRESLRMEEAKRMTGRNSPCPCGSGKKFKRCCGK